MSLNTCSTCKNVGFCAFTKNRVITECAEYEEMSSAPAYDWDLRDLLELWAKPKDRHAST